MAKAFNAGFHRVAHRVRPVPGVQRLDRIGAAQHLADLDVVVQERDEFGPGVLPEPDERRVALPQRSARASSAARAACAFTAV